MKKPALRLLLLPVVAATLLGATSACARTSALSPAGFHVRPVDKAETLSRCRALADLTAEAALDPRAAEIQFRNATAKLNGNYVWIAPTGPGRGYSGRAFQCGLYLPYVVRPDMSAMPFTTNNFDGYGYAPLDCNCNRDGRYSVHQ